MACRDGCGRHAVAAHPATLTPVQLVKAPGQGGDIFLTRGTVVETEWPIGNRSTVYVDEGGYQLIARHVGDGSPLPWGDGRIVRVLTEDAPAPVDPDAAAIEAIVTAYRRSPECSTDPVFGEAMLDHLRAQGFDVTPRAEQ